MPPTGRTEGHDKKQSLREKYNLLARLPVRASSDKVSLSVCPNIFTYGGSASSKPRVLFALSSRADPAEIGFSMKKPCAVLNEAGQKTSADVVRRPQMRYQHSGFCKKSGPFAYWLLNDAADKFELA